MEIKEIDEVSLKILSMLQKNSRESYSEIGRNVGLSAPAVAERVKKMEEAGVIKSYTIEIGHDKMGFGLLAFMLVNLQGSFGVQVEKTENVIANILEVLECHRVTGRDDMILKVLAKDISHLRSVIDSVAPYGQLNTCIVTQSFRDGAFMDIDNYMLRLKEIEKENEGTKK